MEYLLRNSSTLHLLDYFGLIVAVSLLELIIPCRRAGEALRTRWMGNIAVTVVDTVVIRSLFPIMTVATAMLSAERHWGLLHRVQFPLWADVLLSLLAVDLIVYVQHRLFHRVPLLWRMHRVHHTDQDFDFTTAFRFHPLEAIVTTFVNLVAIAVLGASPLAVLASQLLTTSQTLIEHGNFRMPSRFERFVRLALVTPEMHRVHHSQDVAESQSNLATIFSWWDRLFRTYIETPRMNVEKMVFGVAEFQSREHLTLTWILAQPFLRGLVVHRENPSARIVAE